MAVPPDGAWGGVWYYVLPRFRLLESRVSGISRHYKLHRSLGTVNGEQVTGSSATHPPQKKRKPNKRPEELERQRAQELQPCCVQQRFTCSF